MAAGAFTSSFGEADLSTAGTFFDRYDRQLDGARARYRRMQLERQSARPF